MRYTRGAFSIEGRLRGLVAHEASGYEEWGASGAIRVSPSDSGRGLTLSLAPVWGAAGSRTEQLWGARDAGTLGTDSEFDAKARVEAEVEYGIGVPRTRSVVTPYTGVALSESSGRTLRAGTKWKLGTGAVMGVEGKRQSGTDGAKNTNAIEFRTEVRW